MKKCSRRSNLEKEILSARRTLTGIKERIAMENLKLKKLQAEIAEKSKEIIEAEVQIIAARRTLLGMEERIEKKREILAELQKRININYDK